MCGVSTAKINNEEIELFIGYYGGHIRHNGIDFKKDAWYASRDELELSKEEGIKNLSKFTKDELIDMIIQFVDNAEEA
jgi:hypothetical protein